MPTKRTAGEQDQEVGDAAMRSHNGKWTAALLQWKRSLVAGAFVAFLGGCATGPTMLSIQSVIKPPAAGEGRIYLFRESSPFGAAIQPTIKLNGEAVGKMVPGGVLIADRVAGAYTVTVETEVERGLQVDLAAGQSRYVRFDVSMGVLVGRLTPTLMDPVAGARAIEGLAFLGAPPATAAASPSQHPNQPSVASSGSSIALLTRSEVQSLQMRRWRYQNVTGEVVSWDFSGSTVYYKNQNDIGIGSGDWRFNERDALCVTWRSRRVGEDRCMVLARGDGKIIVMDAENGSVVGALLN